MLILHTWWCIARCVHNQQSTSRSKTIMHPVHGCASVCPSWSGTIQACQLVKEGGLACPHGAHQHHGFPNKIGWPTILEDLLHVLRHDQVAEVWLEVLLWHDRSLQEGLCACHLWSSERVAVYKSTCWSRLRGWIQHGWQREACNCEGFTQIDQSNAVIQTKWQTPKYKPNEMNHVRTEVRPVRLGPKPSPRQRVALQRSWCPGDSAVFTALQPTAINKNLWTMWYAISSHFPSSHAKSKTVTEKICRNWWITWCETSSNTGFYVRKPARKLERQQELRRSCLPGGQRWVTANPSGAARTLSAAPALFVSTSDTKLQCSQMRNKSKNSRKNRTPVVHELQVQKIVYQLNWSQ